MSITWNSQVAGFGGTDKGGTTKYFDFVGNNITIAPGQLLVFSAWNQNYPNGPPVANDNINTGTWNSLPQLPAQSFEGKYFFTCWIPCNASGIVTGITINGLMNGVGYGWAVNYYNGFNGTAFYAGSGNSDYTFACADFSTALLANSFNTLQNNELVVAMLGDSSGQTWTIAPSAPWTLRGTINFGGGAMTTYDNLVTSSGTNQQISGTLAGSSLWFVTQVGFYDALPITLANATIAANALNVSTVTSPGTNVFSFTNPAEHINVSSTILNVATYNIVATGANSNISVPTVTDTIAYNAANSTYTHTITPNVGPAFKVSVLADILH